MFSDAELSAKAEEVAQASHLNKAPVDIVSLANRYGIKVFEKCLPDNISGMIMISDRVLDDFGTNSVIVINSSDHPLRRRFTVAHELAHFFIHKNDDEPIYAHRDVEGQFTNQEREADSFAACLLMPEKLLRDAAADLSARSMGPVTGVVLKDFVSRVFLVSSAAAHTRLMQLDMI